MIELPPFDALALSLHHAPGVQAIIVGSGLSRAAGIPTGWEITIDLVRRLAALDGITGHEDWSEWYREKYNRAPSYSEILDAFASTAAERRAILHGYIEPQEDDGGRRPTKAHDAIAQLVVSGSVKVIITTNFDRLIESALREAGIEPIIIASDDAISGAAPLVHSRCTVIKVHGDYLDSRIKNTDAELEAYSPAMNGLLDQVFDNFGLLAVGWSGEWDVALRSAIIRAPTRRYPFYWAARGSIGPLAQDLIDQRGGRSFPISDADSFFGKLDQTLKALAMTSRPHPQSVEMLVALAKRYCRDDQFEMEWCELLEAEAAKIRKFVEGADFPTESPTKDILNHLVSSFVARTEVLRRLSMICGRWGTPKANDSIAKMLQSINFTRDARGGFVSYMRMRNFASSICFFWNLAGLIERGAYDLIHRLHRSKIFDEHKPIEAVMLLPFQTYSDVDWKFLNGKERHHTPISDYLAPLLVKEAGDLAIDTQRAEELFDRTELTQALGYGKLRLERADQSHWYWMPLGRVIWRRGGATLLEELDRLEKLPDDDPLIISKLYGNDKAAVLALTAETRNFLAKIAPNYF